MSLVIDNRSDDSPPSNSPSSDLLPPGPPSSNSGRESASHPWLAWCDRWAVSIGDWLNPILIKETRQALKSRQFVATFSILLFSALGWTVAGSLSMMPQIYTMPSAPRMLIGYYIVLAVPMLLVVPLAAYRSLENEIDDGTLELLSITTLSPWQIVLGKLASAMLQMLLYFIALFPCVAYAYTLRGVDLPTTMIMVFSLLIVGVFLTIVALFFAPIAISRSGRIVTLLLVMAILLASQIGMGQFIIGMIQTGNTLTSVQAFYLILTAVCIFAASGHLLLTTTAAKLTPISENRSTAIRVSLLIFTAVIVAFISIAYRSDLGQISMTIPTIGTVFLCSLWCIMGSMMVGETSVVTPRIRRELPSSFLGRSTLTFLTPGPVTGLVLVSTVGSVLVIGFCVWSVQLESSNRFGSYQIVELTWIRRLLLCAAVYAIGLLVAASWLMRLIRVRNSPRVEVGFAALVAIMVVTALMPYAIGLHFSDYRTYSYNWFQITNWAWTTARVADGEKMAEQVAMVVGVVSIAALILTIFSQPKLFFPRRIAMPRRVLEEQLQERSSR